jgi:translation initiation factor 1 (eIF-1/SUI1)
LKENRTKRVTFRVTEEEYKQLEELAYGSYRLISVYCRDCVFGKEITVIPGVDDAAKQLRRIGNNLKQLTWRVNEGTLSAVNLEETKRELAKIFELLNEKMKGA